VPWQSRPDTNADWNVKNSEEIALVPVIVGWNVPNGREKQALFGRESASLEAVNEKNELR